MNMKQKSSLINEDDVLKSKVVVFAFVLIAMVMLIFASYFIIASVLGIDNKSCKIFLRGDAIYEIELDSGGKVSNIEVYNEKGAIYVAKENFISKDLYDVIEKVAELKFNLRLSEEDNVLVLNCAFSSDYSYKMIKEKLSSVVNSISEKYNATIMVKNFSLNDYDATFSEEKSVEMNSKEYIKHYEDVLTSELKVAVESKMSNVENLINILTPFADSGNMDKVASEDFENVVVNLEEFSANFNYDLSDYDLNNLTYDNVFNIVSKLQEMQNDLEIKFAELDANYNIKNYYEFAYNVKKLLIQGIGA